jgi:hypothetical protein
MKKLVYFYLVLPMITQNQILMARLEQLMEWTEDEVAGLAFCIVAYLMEFSAQSTQVFLLINIGNSYQYHRLP